MLAGSPPSAMTTGMRSPARGHLAPVRRADLVALPVHRERVAAEHLDAVHPDVADPARRIAGDHHRQGDVAPAVAGPGGEERDVVEVDGVAPQHDLLARRAAARGPWAETCPPRPAWGASPACRRVPPGTFISSSSEIRPPIVSRSSTPSARHIRRMEPKRLMATGCGARGGRRPAGRARTAAPGRRRGSSCSGRRSRRSRGGRAPDG